ncbi:MAG: sugar ABC transporter permease [Eubacteriales bacterium]|nr:sugar ABC transporter permease [Eubacteriales bacterium]MDD3880990.1 sugar ABC transporter permease [Eubacteriales bacterium]MDD4511941.1 sugar ABC transporter permease [Eubacteriales bacterium]
MIAKKSTAYFFLLPYLVLFSLFIIVPTVMAIALSFTNFNAVEAPEFVGLTNYINLLTQDTIFLQYVLPNTLIFAIIVGPCGYMLAFFLAWSLSQLTKGPRTVLALIIYSPSMTMGVAMTVVWRVVFLGNQSGIANYALTQLGAITEPIIWMLNTNYILPIIIVVALWSSMGVGFLAMLAGVMNVSPELYEAAAIDGVRNRLQEMFYITIPSMKPQMLFGAVMSVVGAFQAGNIGTMLTGSNPTPMYAGQLIVNHIEDYGFIRYEMGYAAAVSVALLGIIYAFSFIAKRLFSEKD